MRFRGLVAADTHLTTHCGHYANSSEKHWPEWSGDVGAKVGHRMRGIGFGAGKTRKLESNSSRSPHFTPFLSTRTLGNPELRSAETRRSCVRLDWTKLTHVIALAYASKYLQNTNRRRALDTGTSGHRSEGISQRDARCCRLILTAILLKLPGFKEQGGPSAHFLFVRTI